MSSLRFWKMEGLGNDFVLIDCRGDTRPLDKLAARRLADRTGGVGCDQILMLHPPRDGGACAYTIRNADGGEARQCGNGARCIAWWLHRQGELGRCGVLESPAGPVEVTIEGPELVRAQLSPPRFPTRIDQGPDEEWPARLTLAEETVDIMMVDLGNPHGIVLAQNEPDEARLERLGHAANRHPAFPEGVNIGLARVSGPSTVHLRVYERGVGPTRACGSGACAAACALIQGGFLTGPVSVLQPGGALVIEWLGSGEPVCMTGPAREVFKGEIEWQSVSN